ncbi:MAG TPA: hypothetical protein VGP99_12870 [Tepidisphaeraceae bacterium]|nr:hypothetical protein [Tepidisphaeraceae bacterium]
MPFRVRCPRCGQTAEITEDQLGRQGQCNNCGSLVAIPSRLSKVCFICGVDVTHVGHTKDEHNNYLCTNCDANRKPDEPSPLSSSRIECSICHVQFPREQAASSMTGPICRECATILQKEQSSEGIIPFSSDVPNTFEPKRQTRFVSDSQPAATALADPPPALEDLEQLKPTPRPPIPQIYTAPAAQFIRPRFPAAPASRLPVILSSLALLGVIILATLHFSSPRQKESQIEPAVQPAQRDNPDQEILTRVLILKAQAEVLIDVGKLREGIEKYDALLRISSSNPTIAAELESAKSAREKALKLLAASTQRASEEKTVPAPEPQKKPGTIFDEK